MLATSPYSSRVDWSRVHLFFGDERCVLPNHDDSNFKYGATYYLNNRWNKNWGGEFMFEDKYIPVVGNSLVIVKAPFSHKVNPVLSSSMPRLSVQIFMK